MAEGQIRSGDRALGQPGSIVPGDVEVPISGGDILLGTRRRATQLSIEPEQRVILAQAPAGGHFGQGGGFRDAIRRRYGGDTQSPPPDGSATDGGQPGVDSAPRTTRRTDRIPFLPAPGEKIVPPQPQSPPEEYVPISKRKPYVSDTSKDMNKVFEQIVRGGSYVAWGRYDAGRRSAIVEQAISKMPLTSAGTTLEVTAAKDDLFRALQGPLQHAKNDYNAMRKLYPPEKLVGVGWMDNLTTADRATAERFFKLNGLRDALTNNTHSIAQNPMIQNLKSEAFIAAEKLDVPAARMQTAATKYSGEVLATLEKQAGMRRINSQTILRSAGVLGGAWVTNAVVDGFITRDEGPSGLVYATDMLAPLVLFSKQGMAFKYAVLTGSHLVAKIIDKITEDKKS